MLTRRTDTLLDTATTTFPLPPQQPPLSLDSLEARRTAAPSFSLKASLALLPLLAPVASEAAVVVAVAVADDGAAAGEVEPFFFLEGSAEALVFGEAEVFRLPFLVAEEPTPTGAGTPWLCPGGLFSPSSWGAFV